MFSVTPQESLHQLSTYELAALPRRAPCGTPGAYLRHLRNGEPTDEACRRAHREAEKRRRAARTERAGDMGKLRQYVGVLRAELTRAERELAELEAQQAAGSALVVTS
jgi:hypothetical protein